MGHGSGDNFYLIPARRDRETMGRAVPAPARTQGRFGRFETTPPTAMEVVEGEGAV